MKAQIHPQWYTEAQVSCACGNTFTVGSTLPKIHVEVCSTCHPFYTGQMKYIDTAGRVDKFKAKQEAVLGKKAVSKREKRAAKRAKKIKEELARPETLHEVRTPRES